MHLAALPDEAPPIGSPFDLRLAMGEKVEETDIKSALESGEWGFFHSFTTGSGC
jgi:pyruvate formate lyase activating enzyme